MTTHATKPENSSTPQAEGADLDRRNALKKMGKYSAYTAPAMMTLLVSQKATASSCSADLCASAEVDGTGLLGKLTSILK